MVSIRLQRTGRRHHAQFRMVVQDKRRTPTSGRVIANLGFYNPHTKKHGLDLKKAAFYLKQGAQPSSRVIKILLDQKVELPQWVKSPKQRSLQIKHPDKLRRNQTALAESEAAIPATTPKQVVEKTTKEPRAESDKVKSTSTQADQTTENQTPDSKEAVSETATNQAKAQPIPDVIEDKEPDKQLTQEE